MNIPFFKYQGAGNDFVMIDNRSLFFPRENKELVAHLCDRRFGIGADGLILLDPSDAYDFTMVYYNADGTESTMCGNGGRCLVAFAHDLGIIQNETTFDAVDGLHFAKWSPESVVLQMIDVHKVEWHSHHAFLDTGSPHHVALVKDIDTFNVVEEGKKIRYGAPYFEEGTNVNFAEQIQDNFFKVRTYERGVEDETLACGTGCTAVAIAMYEKGLCNNNKIDLEVKGGLINVSFDKTADGSYQKVMLEGPAKFVFKGDIDY